MRLKKAKLAIPSLTLGVVAPPAHTSLTSYTHMDGQLVESPRGGWGKVVSMMKETGLYLTKEEAKI